MSASSKIVQGETTRAKIVKIIYDCDMEGDPFPRIADVAREIGASQKYVSFLIRDLIDTNIVYNPSPRCYRLRELDNA